MKTRREFLRVAGVAPAIGVLDCSMLGSILGGQAMMKTESLHAGRPLEQETSGLVDALRDRDPRIVWETARGEMLIPLRLVRVPRRANLRRRDRVREGSRRSGHGNHVAQDSSPQATQGWTSHPDISCGRAQRDPSLGARVGWSMPGHQAG